jgi:hypothetical protein
MTQPRFQLRAITLMLLAATISMGNESCEKSKSRVLKMEVEVGNFRARPIRLPNGEMADFPDVVNSLFFYQTMNHDNFLIYVPEGATTVSSNRTLGSVGVVSKGSVMADTPVPASLSHFGNEDIELLGKYGFIEQMAYEGRLENVHSKSGSVSTPNGNASIPACLYERPLARLGGEMISFESHFGAGIGIGYGPSGPIPGGNGGAAQVNFSASRLQLMVRWNDTFTRQPIAMTEGVSHNSDVGFRFAFPGTPVGIDFFYKTPIANTIKAAIQKGLDSLVSAYVKAEVGANKTWADAWEGRVLYNSRIDNDNLIAFRGGARAGIVAGDKFMITNLAYEWHGEPCSSAAKYTIPLGGPVAEVEVIESRGILTVAKVTRTLYDSRIIPGARVQIAKLYEPETPKKK